jgi:hypothetical protein
VNGSRHRRLSVIDEQRSLPTLVPTNPHRFAELDQRRSL